MSTILKTIEQTIKSGSQTIELAAPGKACEAPRYHYTFADYTSAELPGVLTPGTKITITYTLED